MALGTVDACLDVTCIRVTQLNWLQLTANWSQRPCINEACLIISLGAYRQTLWTNKHTLRYAFWKVIRYLHP